MAVSLQRHPVPFARRAHRIAALGALTALAAAAGCASARPAPGAPAPVRAAPPPADAAPSAAVAAVSRDSARVTATPRRPAAATVTARPAPDATAPASARSAGRRASGGPLPTARVSARNDTLIVRTLRAPVRVCAGGDVTLGTNLDREWSRAASRRMRTAFGQGDDPASLLAPLSPLVRGSDVLLLNVESAVGEGATPSKCGPRSTNCFAFRSPAAAAPALRALTDAVVVGNIANNHARDAGTAGVDSTVAVLTRAGVLVTGADTLATPVVTPAGDTIGILGFYTSSDTPDARDTAVVRRHVARAAARYPVVVATMHLGAEGVGAQRTLDQEELFLRIDRGNPVAFADAAVRGGAALVIGHGPHVLRGMEWRPGGALIAYSMGNLLTYGPFVLREPLNRGALLCSTIGPDGRVRSATLRPTLQRAVGLVREDPSRRAAALVDSLSRLDFPVTGVTVGRDGVIRPHGAAP